MSYPYQQPHQLPPLMKYMSTTPVEPSPQPPKYSFSMKLHGTLTQLQAEQLMIFVRQAVQLAL